MSTSITLTLEATPQDKEFLNNYFEAIAPIWEEFQNKNTFFKMGMNKREEHLQYYRLILHKLNKKYNIKYNEPKTKIPSTLHSPRITLATKVTFLKED